MQKTVFLAVILSLFLVATVSAYNPSINMKVISNLTQTHDGRLDLRNDGDVNLTDVTLSSIADFPVYFSLNHFDMPVPGENNGYSVSPTTSLGSLDDLTFGYNPLKIEAHSPEGAYDSVDMNIERSFCTLGPQGSGFEIYKINVNTNGDVDNQWVAGDQATIDVGIENDNEFDIDGVYVELGLFDEDGRNVANDLDFFDKNMEKNYIGTVKKGDREQTEFVFKVPTDLKEGNYKLTLKAYSQILGEANLCMDHSTEFENSFFNPIELIGGSHIQSVVFVTSFKVNTPNLRDVPTADDYCQIAADNAGLSGKFVAWLSGTNQNAIDRVTDSQFVRTDGQLIANNKTDLIDGTLNKRITLDEYGNKLDSGLVYTGTKGDGTAWGANMCNNWHGLNPRNSVNFALGYGNINSWDKSWTQAGKTTCDEAYRKGAHLYCFQIA